MRTLLVLGAIVIAAWTMLLILAPPGDCPWGSSTAAGIARCK